MRRPKALPLFGAALGFASLFAIWGCGEIANARQGPRTPEQIYDTTCGYCHGHNVGPIIKGRKLPAVAVETFVRTGSGAMPAFKPTEISDAELKALAKWISDSKANDKEHGA
jgi:mono/diheme cytochrome c family protein